MTTTPARATYQASVWGFKTDVLEVVSHDGERRPIRFDSWINTEIDRWHHKNGRQAWAEENKTQVILPGGYVAERGEVMALFSWAEYQRTVEGEE